MLAVAILQVVGLGIICIFVSLYVSFSCLIMNTYFFFPNKTKKKNPMEGIEVHDGGAGGLVFRTQSFHSCGSGSIPGLGTEIPC